MPAAAIVRLSSAEQPCKAEYYHPRRHFTTRYHEGVLSQQQAQLQLQQQLQQQQALEMSKIPSSGSTTIDTNMTPFIEPFITPVRYARVATSTLTSIMNADVSTIGEFAPL